MWNTCQVSLKYIQLFSIVPNTNLVDDVKIMLPVKFCWSPFGSCNEEVKCISQSEAERTSWFSDRSEKCKRERGRWDFAYWQVSSNSVQWLQKISRKCLSESEAGRPSLFSDRHEKHKLGLGRWDLVSCQVLSHSIQWLHQLKKWKL